MALSADSKWVAPLARQPVGVLTKTMATPHAWPISTNLGKKFAGLLIRTSVRMSGRAARSASGSHGVHDTRLDARIPCLNHAATAAGLVLWAKEVRNRTCSAKTGPDWIHAPGVSSKNPLIAWSSGSSAKSRSQPKLRISLRGRAPLNAPKSDVAADVGTLFIRSR